MLVDVRSASHELAVSEKTVKRLLTAGVLPSVKIGGRRRIRREALEAFVGLRGPRYLTPSSTSCSSTF